MSSSLFRLETREMWRRTKLIARFPIAPEGHVRPSLCFGCAARSTAYQPTMNSLIMYCVDMHTTDAEWQFIHRQLPCLASDT